MSITEQLIEAFPQESSAGSLEDSYILANPDVMELPSKADLLNVVPAYMIWCTENPNDTGLASDNTLAALAEYGRCKTPHDSFLNFRYLCSQDQLEAVVAFLAWASQTLPFHNEGQVARALRNWKRAANKSSKRTRG